MRRVSAISFLVIFLTANTTFGQILRLPTLIHHYLEHVEWDNNSSLIDFLATHYAVKIDHPDDKHHDHQKLPLKTSDCHISQAATIVPQLLLPPPIVSFEPTDLKIAVRNQQKFSNSYLNNIWQPPRFS